MHENSLGYVGSILNIEVLALSHPRASLPAAQSAFLHSSRTSSPWDKIYTAPSHYELLRSR